MGMRGVWCCEGWGWEECGVVRGGDGRSVVL